MPTAPPLEGLPWTKPALSRPMTTAPMPRPCAPRLAALRAELAKRGLDGFVVPHSDEHQGEYLPASAERLAWLTSFTGSAGAAVVLKDKAAVFVDGRYTLAGPRPDRHIAVRAARSGGGRPARLDSRSICRKGAKLGYDPWLHHRQCAWRACARRRNAPAAPWSPATAIRSTRCGPTSPPPPMAQGRAACAESGRRRAQSQARPHRRGPEESRRRRRGDHLARIRSAGCSTSAAATCRTRPSRWPSPSCTPTAAPICSWTSAKRIARAARSIWAMRVRLRARSEFTAALDALKGKTVLADPATAAAAIFDRLNKAGAKIKQRRRSLPAAQGLQEPAGDRRHAQGAYPRRRGAVALSLLVRARGARTAR